MKRYLFCLWSERGKFSPKRIDDRRIASFIAMFCQLFLLVSQLTADLIEAERWLFHSNLLRSLSMAKALFDIVPVRSGQQKLLLASCFFTMLRSWSIIQMMKPSMSAQPIQSMKVPAARPPKSADETAKSIVEGMR